MGYLTVAISKISKYYAILLSNYSQYVENRYTDLVLFKMMDDKSTDKVD